MSVVKTLNSKRHCCRRICGHTGNKHESEEVKLHFEKGELVAVNDNSFSHPPKPYSICKHWLAFYGIGRDIHVGDTIIGIKGRVGFEAAAPMVILKAHHALRNTC